MTNLDLSAWDPEVQEAVSSFLDFWNLAKKVGDLIGQEPTWAYDRIQDQLRTPIFAIDRGDLPPLSEPLSVEEEEEEGTHVGN